MNGKLSINDIKRRQNNIPVQGIDFELVEKLNEYIEKNGISYEEVARDTNLSVNTIEVVCSMCCIPSDNVLEAIRAYLKNKSSVVNEDKEELNVESLLFGKSKDTKVLFMNGVEEVDGEVKFRMGADLLSLSELVNLINKDNCIRYSDGLVQVVWKSLPITESDIKEAYRDRSTHLDYLLAKTKARNILSKLPENQVEFLEGDDVIDQALNYLERYIVD